MNGSELPWTRREFLLLALAGLVGCRPNGDVGDVVTAKEALPGWVRGGTGDPQAAARIGQAYLEAFPAEADRQRLIALLEKALIRHAGGVDPDALSDVQRIERLGGQLRAEYAAGDTVQVQRWVLSRSEARLYGLAALATPGFRPAPE